MDDVIRSVKDVARRHVEKEKAAGLEDPDASLSALGVGSLEMVCLMLDLEQSFSIEFPDHMIDAETFSSVGTIADAVRALRERA